MFTHTCTSVMLTRLSCIPTSDCNRSSQFVVPGWNDAVKDAHTEARHAYVTWREYGKHRQGPVCELMRTRLRFKYALRQCHATEDTARADALAKQMSENDMMSFWRSVKAINSKSVPLTHTIDGVTGNDNISEMK